MKQNRTMLRSNGRILVATIGIIAWSALMILVGSAVPGFGISPSQAATQRPVVRLRPVQVAVRAQWGDIDQIPVVTAMPTGPLGKTGCNGHDACGAVAAF